MPNYCLKWGLANIFPGLALNHDPPDLHFWSSWDYRHEPMYPGLKIFLIFNWNDNTAFSQYFEHVLHAKCGFVTLANK
jgi:hypothetical protein